MIFRKFDIPEPVDTTNATTDGSPPKMVLVGIPDHDLIASHTVSGLTPGQVLTATSANTFGFATVSGGAVADVVPVGSNQILTAGDLDNVYLLKAAGLTVTLPNPAEVGSGWKVHVKEAANDGTSQILRFGGENIDLDPADVTLAIDESRWLVTDGVDWWSI